MVPAIIEYVLHVQSVLKKWYKQKIFFLDMNVAQKVCVFSIPCQSGIIALSVAYKIISFVCVSSYATFCAMRQNPGLCHFLYLS